VDRRREGNECANKHRKKEQPVRDISFLTASWTMENLAAGRLVSRLSGLFGSAVARERTR